MTGALTLSGAPSANLHAATKLYVDESVAAGGGKIQSELIDANATDGNIYKLKIDNDQVEFYRGAASEDKYLNIFGSSNSVVHDMPK